MRLWHEDLIRRLPRQQLLGQHRECCALRGKGWGKAHSTVDYVFEHKYQRLFEYHKLIMLEMLRRKYKPNKIWFNFNYRGKALGYDKELKYNIYESKDKNIYPEHNKEYLKECLDNLADKGINI